MELRIEPYSAPAQILFNHEELKRELTERCKVYETMVYTEEQVSVAKTDRANLNALKKALNDERLRRQREYMKPFDLFKAQIDEVIALVEKPIGVIDLQIKAFDEKRQQEKLEAIKAEFAKMGFPDFVRVEHVFDRKWLNKTCPMSTITADMGAAVQRIEKDLKTLSNLPEFSAEALTEYRYSRDMGRALEAVQRAAEVAKAKARAAETPPPPTVQPEPAPAPAIQPAVSTGLERYWIGFEANLSNEEAVALGAYFREHGIQYRRPQPKH